MTSTTGHTLDADDLMDTAVRLKDEEPCVLDELVPARHKEEVHAQHSLALAQFGLCTLEVEVDVQTLQELCHGVAVPVGLLFCDK